MGVIPLSISGSTGHPPYGSLTPQRGIAQGRDGQFWTDLRAALAAGRAEGGRLEVWNRGRRGPVYASANEQEYWAEGAQAWFDNANPNNSGGLSVRDDVKRKDPRLAALLAEIYGDGQWRYIKTTARDFDGAARRPPAALAHLEGLDAVRNQIPVFNFNNSPRRMAALAQGITPREGNAGSRARRRGTTTGLRATGGRSLQGINQALGQIKQHLVPLSDLTP